MMDIQPDGFKVAKSLNQKFYSLTANEILNILVSIADKAEEMLNPKMFNHPYFMYGQTLHEGTTYGDLINDAVKSLGIENKNIHSRGYETPFGRADKIRNDSVKLVQFGTTIPRYKYHSTPIQKSHLEETLDNLENLDYELFKATDENDLMIVDYKIDFPWSSMNGYFSGKDLPLWFEELGFPKFMIPTLSKAYATRQRFLGRKDENEVSEEMLKMLKRVNPDGTAVIDAHWCEGDVFVYDNHLFYLRRNENSSIEYTPTISPYLQWGYALYNAKLEKPIGYQIIKTEDRVNCAKKVNLLK